MDKSLPVTEADHRFTIGNHRIALLAGLALLVGLALTATRIVIQYQTPGPFDPSAQGLCDFHNGIYFPTRALLQGISPYGQAYADANPVARQIPFFSPLILILHTPFVLLPLRVAEVAFLLFSVFIMLAIGAVVAAAIKRPKSLDVILTVAAAMVYTRGGHVTLFDGYFTFELVLAVFLSIYWSDHKRPILAAFALAIVSAKPTYILPLGFLMLARGNYKPLIYGAILSVLGLVIPMGVLAWTEGQGDVMEGSKILAEHIERTQELHMSQEDETPIYSWTRLDLLAVIAKWVRTDPSQLTHILTMLVILVIPMSLLWRDKKLGLDDGLTGLSGALVMTAVLVSMYHHAYDTLLFAAPLAGLAVAQLPAWKTMSKKHRYLIAALMSIPCMNYLSTRAALVRFDPESTLVRVATSVNAIVLAALLVLLCWVVWQRSLLRKSTS